MDHSSTTSAWSDPRQAHISSAWYSDHNPAVLSTAECTPWFCACLPRVFKRRISWQILVPDLRELCQSTSTVILHQESSTCKKFRSCIPLDFVSLFVIQSCKAGCCQCWAKWCRNPWIRVLSTTDSTAINPASTGNFWIWRWRGQWKGDISLSRPQP